MSARPRPVNQRSQVENTGGCRDNREIIIRSCVAYTTPCGAWGGLHTVPKPKTPMVGAPIYGGKKTHETISPEWGQRPHGRGQRTNRTPELVKIIWGVVWGVFGGSLGTKNPLKI